VEPIESEHVWQASVLDLAGDVQAHLPITRREVARQRPRELDGSLVGDLRPANPPRPRKSPLELASKTYGPKPCSSQ